MASDCAQQFTPRAGSDAIGTEVNAMEPNGRQGAWRYFVVSRVNIGLGRRRKAGGRCVTLSGVTVIASRCIRRPGPWKKTRASARKLVDPGSQGCTSALQGAPFEWLGEAGTISVFGMLTKWPHTTRLETRTKETIVCASIWVENPHAE